MSLTRRLDVIIRTAGLAVVVPLLIVACGGSGQATSSPPATASGSPAGPAATAQATPEAPSATPAGGGDGTAAEIAGFAFSPADLTVPAGATVTWTNKDSAAHTVTADDGSFDSSRLASGATFSNTFAAPGTFAFHCAIHPAMKGTITVTP